MKRWSISGSVGTKKQQMNVIDERERGKVNRTETRPTMMYDPMIPSDLEMLRSKISGRKQIHEQLPQFFNT